MQSEVECDHLLPSFTMEVPWTGLVLLGWPEVGLRIISGEVV